MLSKKNTILGKFKFIFCLLLFSEFVIFNSFSENLKGEELFAELSILDKVSSKTSNIKINIGKEFLFQNLIINVLKCSNSKFDDNPEVTAYLQVKDITSKNKDQVYIFNDWTFSSSPSIRPFDHPVYDIWLKNCYS